MCIHSFSSFGVFLLITLFLALLFLDSVMSVLILLKREVSIKKFLRAFGIVAFSWVLSGWIFMFIPNHFGWSNIVVRLSTYIIPLLLFFITRTYLFGKFFKIRYLKSIIVSTISLIVFLYVFVHATQWINYQYNTRCYPDVIVFDFY